MVDAKRPERARLMITSATVELAGERLALRFPIDGAGEAIGLRVGRLAAGIVGDQIGEGARLRARAGDLVAAGASATRRRDGVGGDRGLGVGRRRWSADRPEGR